MRPAESTKLGVKQKCSRFLIRFIQQDLFHLLAFVFRVGNMRESSLVEAHVRAILISKKVTQEGEVMPYSQTELSVSVNA